MNLRFSSFTVSAVSQGHFHAEFAVRMHSRANEQPTRVESICWSGSSMDELQNKIVASSKQVLIVLSEHHFWVPTSSLTGFYDRRVENGKYIMGPYTSFASTPWVTAEMLLEMEIADKVLRKVALDDEYSSLGIWALLEFFQELRHYGRLPTLREGG